MHRDGMTVGVNCITFKKIEYMFMTYILFSFMPKNTVLLKNDEYWSELIVTCVQNLKFI